MQEVLASHEQQQTYQIHPFDRIRLGGDELAICGQVTLVPGSAAEQKILILDVGFRQAGQPGEFGPYDIDGSGEKRIFQKPYVLVSSVETENGKETRVHEFDTNENVLLGRTKGTAAEELGFGHNMEVSRQHAQLQITEGGGVHVTDLGSTNGTDVISGRELLPDAGNSVFGYTVSIDDYVHRAGRGGGLVSRKEKLGWGNGVYEGRNIIGRDTPINTGVYPVGGQTGEALVVDDKKYPGPLNEVYEGVVARLGNVKPGRTGLKGIKKALGRKPASEGTEELMIRSVFEEVSSTLDYNLEATNAIAKNYQKVDLGYYIEEGVGVCRTQALLCAYLLERLASEGKINGRVSIDRNQDVFEGVESGHAWTRFTTSSGEVFIIDPAQGFVGSLEESRTGVNRWDYRRTEDLTKSLLAA